MDRSFVSSSNLSLPPLIAAAAATVICCLCVLWAVRSEPGRNIRKERSKRPESGGGAKKACGCTCSCGGAPATPYANGSAGEKFERATMTGASMMEQLVPEITTHALSYLDYPSLCRLSMTNSSMRRAANDDSAWKALYHKDFTVEQDSVTPVNGWKAYYAATKAIVNINAEFYRIIKERSFEEMGRLWLRADYVKCVHASGELFTGYNAVMDSWALAFNWAQAVAFQVQDVCARVLPDVAWVTMKAYADMDTGPFNMTNVYELHKGQWYMVHHHSSVTLIGGVVDPHNIFG
eukprot:TRINITY_DN5627_c0_g2_i1.p1 TRINITY_DN5627_c0_g2~~TRINITY_DN5627_c0_g2_i1.p1  ORF type:complete len:292 (+),score=33.53 TRINITY_DN5627_c0_g2_i1:293-1168(+)